MLMYQFKAPHRDWRPDSIYHDLFSDFDFPEPSTFNDKYEGRIAAILEYASENEICRNQYLLKYFGEKNTTKCGSCDVCMKRNEMDITTYEFDKIVHEIKIILKNLVNLFL